MIQPDSDDYYTTTHVFRRAACDWVWTARLSQPWPALNQELAYDDGWCWTEKGAKRKADRAARRMMRAAASWTSRTYKAGKDVTA